MYFDYLVQQFYCILLFCQLFFSSSSASILKNRLRAVFTKSFVYFDHFWLWILRWVTIFDYESFIAWIQEWRFTYSSDCEKIKHLTAVSPGISITILILTFIWNKTIYIVYLYKIINHNDEYWHQALVSVSTYIKSNV